MLRLQKTGPAVVRNNGQKKPAHRERVNPSFGRVEETGVTIDLTQADEKFLLAITCMRFSDIWAGVTQLPEDLCPLKPIRQVFIP
jgi:hypothetical protein